MVSTFRVPQNRQASITTIPLHSASRQALSHALEFVYIALSQVEAPHPRSVCGFDTEEDRLNIHATISAFR